MAIFDFLSGSSGGASYDPQAMQSYQQFQQPADYSQILGGGQSSPTTQGLDFAKIGDWATQMAQKTQFAQDPKSANFQGVLGGGNAVPAQHGPDWQKLLATYGATKPTQATGQQPQLPGRQPNMPLGQVQQGMAGYIGNGTRGGLLGMVR